MYLTVLFLHSLVRWVALIALAVRAGLAVHGLATGRDDGPVDKRAGLATIIAMDLQLLLGLALYLGLSPQTAIAFQDMGAAMKDAALRFWAVEHITMMLVAIVLAHVGFALAKRAAVARARHRWAAMFFGLSLLAVLIAIPWPFRDAIARPWLTLP